MATEQDHMHLQVRVAQLEAMLEEARAKQDLLLASVRILLPIPLHPPADESKTGDYNRLLDARSKLRYLIQDFSKHGGA